MYQALPPAFLHEFKGHAIIARKGGSLGTRLMSMYYVYVAVKTFSRFLGCFSWSQSPLGSCRVYYKVNIALKECRHPAKSGSN